MAGNGIVIHYAPQITVQGGGPGTQEAVQQALQLSRNDLEKMMREVLADQQRRLNMEEAALSITQEALAVAPQPLIGIDPSGMIALANDAACRLFPDQGPLIGQGGDEALPEALAPLLDGRSRDTDVVCAGRAYHVEAHPLGGHEGERGLLLSFTCEGCQR